MNDAVPVRVVQRARHLGGDAKRVAHGELPLALESAAQRFPLDVRHDVVELAVGRTGVEERKDVRVLKAGGRLDLGQEPLRAEHGTQLRMQDLDRNLSVVSEVLRQEHRGHPARPELALETVALRERGGEGAGERGEPVIRGADRWIGRSHDPVVEGGVVRI